MPKLTERLCEQARPDPTRDVYLRDDVVSGFALRILPSGAKAFELRCRIDGRLRRMSLGAYVPDVGSLARARRAAVDLRAKIVSGENPADQRIERRKADAIKATSFKTLCDRWIASAQTGRGRGGKLEGRIRKSWKADREQLDRHFGDWSTAPLGSITPTEVAKRLNLIARRSPVAANRCASLLSTIFRSAVRWGLTTTNPAAEAPRSPEQPRERYLDDSETARLLVALDAEPDPRWKAFFGLSIYLGTRRGELLQLRWDHVRDLDGELPAIDLASSTTKTARARTLPLPAPAAELLREVANDEVHGRMASAFVFSSSTSAGGILVGVRKRWLALCERAGIAGLNLHDTRRGLASGFAAAGHPLSIAQHVLGHVTPHMTATVYTRVGDDARRRALDEHAARLERAKAANVAKVKKLSRGA